MVLSVEGVLSVEREGKEALRKATKSASSRERFLLRVEPVSRSDEVENFEGELSSGKNKERAGHRVRQISKSKVKGTV